MIGYRSLYRVAHRAADEDAVLCKEQKAKQGVAEQSKAGREAEINPLQVLGPQKTTENQKRAYPKNPCEPR